MDTFLPAFIMGFREGLEAFLIVSIILQYLRKSKNESLRKYVYYGTISGIVASLGIGGILYILSKAIDRMDEVAKLWESGASFVALALVTTFIYWMIKHGRNMVSTVESSVSQNLSAFGIASVAFIMVAREGVEVAIFTFAGQYGIAALFAGIAAALVLAVLINHSLVKVNLRILFNITLAYLILQAGFLLGYGIHEGLSALGSMNLLASESPLFIKAFDLSETIFYHKEGLLGLPMYVVFGWYSKPEILQFIMQYLYTGSLFYIWHREINKEASKLNSFVQ
ncbi:FTR1 family protein [Trichococcus sp. K1Tr]|uniref:FTR1 family iron permease n=1 Tax=Trichococcus sp. K1Tr TaxID=3020847 RepID=UPI00232E6D41|nr:FTR1 family protein [Trichococcus sp. K1Tr]MDB6354475.1 FTR1 family protein [Trichococcus sp. K1Tr]